jgi:hypothetical protein
MRTLDGLPLASFGERAAAFAIDFLLAAFLFVLAAVPIGKFLEKILHRDVRIELNLFHNWYSIVYLVLFFGASLYLGGPDHRQTDYANPCVVARPRPCQPVALGGAGVGLWRLGT